jgi:hypothetical protein
MSRLRPSLQSSAQLYIFVCLLLTLSFLFNPYLFAAGSEGGLNVRHHASYRATVAFSELEKYSPQVSQDSHEFVAHLFTSIFSLVPDTALHFFLRGLDLPLGRKFICANLRFRPPPTV